MQPQVISEPIECGPHLDAFGADLQRRLQYLTCSQSRFHFFRHLKGRIHTGQTFSGRCSFRMLNEQSNFALVFWIWGIKRYPKKK